MSEHHTVILRNYARRELIEVPWKGMRFVRPGEFSEYRQIDSPIPVGTQTLVDVKICTYDLRGIAKRRDKRGNLHVESLYERVP